MTDPLTTTGGFVTTITEIETALVTEPLTVTVALALLPDEPVTLELLTLTLEEPLLLALLTEPLLEALVGVVATTRLTFSPSARARLPIIKAMASVTKFLRI